MLDRIVVNIVNMRRKIVFVRNCMLPIAPLPDAALAGTAAKCRISRSRNSAREAGLDPTPTAWKVAVALGQRPDAMQMVRQDADCSGLERLNSRGFGVGGAEFPDALD